MLAALACLCLYQSRAHAQETHVDWQRGLLLARAAVPGDLSSPSREMARVKAERQARERCRSKLLAAQAKLPLAGGLRRTAIEDDSWPLATTAIDYGMDGSVVVEMALPLDALRTIFAGPDAPTALGNTGPQALIIDARKHKLSPAIGFSISDDKTEYRGPTLFFVDEESARNDARIGKGATILAANALHAGVLRVPEGALAELLQARPLVIILHKVEDEAKRK